MNQQFPLAASAMNAMNSQIPFQAMYFPHQQMVAGNNQLYHPSYVMPTMIPTLPQPGVSQSMNGIPSIIPPITQIPNSTTAGTMKSQQQQQQQQQQHKNNSNTMNRNQKDNFASGIAMPNQQQSLPATQLSTLHPTIPSGPMVPFMKPIDNGIPPQQQQPHFYGVAQQQQQYAYPQQQQHQMQQQQFLVQQPIMQNPQQMIQPTNMLPPPGFHQNYNQGVPQNIPQQYQQPPHQPNYQQQQQPIGNHYHGDPPPPQNSALQHHNNQRPPQHIKKGISKDYSYPPHRGGPGILGIGHGNPKNQRGGKGNRSYRDNNNNNKPYRGGGDSNGYGDRQNGYDNRDHNNNHMYPPPSQNGQPQFQHENQQAQYPQQYQPQLDAQSGYSYQQQQHQNNQKHPPVGERDHGEFPQQEQNNSKMQVTPSDSQNKLNVSAFHKTKMCPTIGEGQPCKKGEKCGYAHSEKELRSPPNLKKTKICMMFEKSRCNLGDKCDFAHGSEELKNFVERYKTMLCQDFEKTGECFQGSRCQYAHGKNELRQPKFVQNQSKGSNSPTSQKNESRTQQPKSAPLNQTTNSHPGENKPQEISAPYTMPLPQPLLQEYPMHSAGSSVANPVINPAFTDPFGDKFSTTPNQQQNATNQKNPNNNAMQVQSILPQHYQAQQPYGYV